MNRARKIAVTVSLGFFGLCLAGSFLTRGVMEHLPFLHGQKESWAETVVPRGIVDQRPWQTAATLAELAESAEEREFAREAERLADHEVNQAFSQSLRQANLAVRQLTGPALVLQQRVTELQKTVAEDRARVAALSASQSKPGSPAGAGAGPAATQSDLDVAKAQLGLDENELSDSQEDLARESGDQRIQLQQELSSREAAMKKFDTKASADDGQTAVISAERYKTLAGQISAWWAQRSRRKLIDEAEQLARADIAALTGDHERLEEDAKKAGANGAAPIAQGDSNSGKVDGLQRMAEQRNVLSILDDRLLAQQQLAALYVRWGKQVELQHKIVMHLMFTSLAWIAAIILLTIVTGWLLQVILERMSRDRRQKATLRSILNLGTQVLGLVLVLLVIFGTPA